MEDVREQNFEAVVIESDPDARRMLCAVLERLGAALSVVEADASLPDAKGDEPAFWYIDLCGSKNDTDAIVAHALTLADVTVLLGDTAEDTPRVIAALRNGAFDVLVKPFDASLLERRLGIAAERVSLLKKAVMADALLRETMNAQSVESLSVLAGGIAHDFNNILSIILSNARAFGRKPPNDPSIRNMIIKATERAVLLTKQLVEYSGRGHYPLKPIGDLSPFLEKTLDELDREVPGRHPITVSHAVEPLPIYADSSQIVQLIKNLVINAYEAVEKNGGEVFVSTRIVDTAEQLMPDPIVGDPIPEGECVVLTVKDTGSGIPTADRAKVFEPFYTTKFIGRGLGLSAVLGIVRRHGGAIRLDSDTDMGTEVGVYLPLFKQVGKDLGLSRPAPLALGTVLVVDDDEICRAMARTMLDKMGFDTLMARDGLEALNVYKENADHIDCILLDIVMPRMNGHACFREIRKLSPEVPVIMASGYDYYDAVRGLAKENLNGFLTKPFRMRTLISTLSEVLGLEISVPTAYGH